MKYNSVLAEFFGTLAFVLSIFFSGGSPIIIGVALVIVLYLSGKSNPGHVNPAISVAMYVKGDISFEEMVHYITAQMLGGISSVYIYRLFF